jgi:uncharacterized protein YkwD
VTTRRLATLLLLATSCARLPAPPREATRTAGSPSPAPPCTGYGDDAPVARSPLEERAWSELQRSLPRGVALHPSGALDRAARLLAAPTDDPGEDPLSRDRVQRTLSAAGAWDPAPSAHLFAGPADDALAALLARFDAAGATHAGLGVHGEGETPRVVLLLSRRLARLDPFPGSVATGADGRLSGELVGLLHPRAFVTRPDGSSEEVDLPGGRAFAGTLRFAAPGSHAVEVIGTGARGPEVAALLAVSAGGAPCGAPASRREASPEPPDPREAEASVAAAINRARRAQGLAAVQPSPALAAVARAQSERMRAAGTVAHVLPGSGDLVDRLGAARIPYRRAFENVASGATSLAAHAAAEASPAHRANLLAPSADRLGVGIARGTLPTGEPIVYLTEILLEPAPDHATDRLTPDARVREALWRERARRGLPSLTNDAALEGLARAAASRMRAEDAGEVEGLTEGALRLGRDLAASDAFIAGEVGEAVRSRNLVDPRFRRVGVGVAPGDSRRFGPARLFIAVVYSD